MSSEVTHIYPPHLCDITRRELAIELIKKEFGKLPTNSPNESNIDVAKWLSEADEHTFWNAIEGFMGGALLKPIVRYLSAENYSISRAEVPILSIQLSSKLAQLDVFTDLAPDKLLISEINNRLLGDDDERKRQIAITRQYRKPESSQEYPILVVRKKGQDMVMDGNSRALMALLRGENSIQAWVIDTHDESPRNYWYPIDDLMRLTNIFLASREENPSSKKIIQQTLRAIFAQTEVARTAYRTRLVAMGTPGAEELFNDL